MNNNLIKLAMASCTAMVLLVGSGEARADGNECSTGLCGTPNQSGGGCGCGCGCGSILVAMTDRGDTYQFADDQDGDGIEDEFDNCAFSANYDQTDSDGDQVGDSCDSCAAFSNPAQRDMDADGMGDECDGDTDGDSIDNVADKCATVPDLSQLDTDGDNAGDACDLDDDGDGLPDLSDACRLLAGGTAGQFGCDDDPDGDGIFTDADNCATVSNPVDGGLGVQSDLDGNGIGDACDLDMDGDGFFNWEDNCAGKANPQQLDLDRDGMGDGGNWSGGSESCDAQECYVIGGDSANCLNPTTAFQVKLALIGQRVDEKFELGETIRVALFSNRLGTLHNWTARFESLPGDSEARLKNAKGAAATLMAGTYATPQVASCLRQAEDGTCAEMNVISFKPDAPGKYIIKVSAELPSGDALGPAASAMTIVAEVGGEAQGGCASTSGSAASLAALVLGLGALTGLKRRKK